MVDYIENESFYAKTKIVYPPFKNGLYMEEYFLDYVTKNNIKYDKNGRLYIPCLWTNFQTEPWFQERKDYMQQVLDNWILNHPNKPGYFVVVQHDDGPMLQLPQGTLIYGACNGQIPLPLIYQDIENRLASVNKKSFKNKTILCSFVGSATHNVRNNLIKQYKNDYRFKFSVREGWTNQVQEDHKSMFVDWTVNSKFALAPRGYGKSSFRFFECFLLGTIPVYIWDDKEWLPYKDILDYDKFSISIHESEIDILDEILMNVNEKKYNKMLEEYEKIKHMFELEYMCEFICSIPVQKQKREPTENVFKKVTVKVTSLKSAPEQESNRDSKLKPKVLLVAIAIGEKYLEMYNELFRKSHENYAKKHEYDFKVVTDFLDKNNKHYSTISFNKSLVFSQTWSKDYDFIIFIDSDILINPIAPALHNYINYGDKIGIVNEYSQPTPEIRLQIQAKQGWERFANEYYKLSGFDINTDAVLNTGVIVSQPKIHGNIFQNIYNKYIKKSINHKRGFHYEQSCIGYELQKQCLYKTLPNKWNIIWGLYKICGENLDNIFKDNYFIHFAGGIDTDKVLDLHKYL